MSERTTRRRKYWLANLRYLLALLSVWAAVSLGGGVLFVDVLDRVNLPGTRVPLGFWIAQQGSIYTFIVLIFVYVWLMNRLDRKFHQEDRNAPRS